MGFLKFFTANSAHRNIFIPRNHEKRFLGFILRSVHSFTLALDLSVTWQQQQVAFASLWWSNVSIAQRFSAAVPRERLYVPLTRFTKLNLIGCMWCVKHIIVGGNCLGVTEV